MKFSLIALLSMTFSCSRINVQSRDMYYSSKQKIRHGIIPIETTSQVEQRLSEESIERGKLLYVAHCLSCHGPRGIGDGPNAKDQKIHPADLQRLAKDVPNFKFFMSVSQWQGDMPGWKVPFNELDREDLVAYIKTLRWAPR
jgi:mono/diheme cytochrome c family protein